MSPIGDAEWDAFALSQPTATFFHRSQWRHVAPAVFGHRAHYLSVREAGGLAAVLPLVQVRSRLFGHALISNAFCVGGGPLATTDCARNKVLEQAERLGRRLGADYLELRDTPEGASGWLSRDGLHCGFERPITADVDEELKRIPRRQRAVVRKAMAQGLEFSVERSPEAFFPLYALTMRNHGTPALPRRFFEQLFISFGDDCEILTVRRSGRAVSSVLSYFFRGRAMPYYTGSLPEAREIGSNDLMYWLLMRRAVERGCSIFDFGRSKVGTGPFAFKRNWGFEPRPITHQFRLLKATSQPEINPVNPKYAALIKGWRRLPLPLANAVSPLLSRSLG